jgi:hypothetical protein
MRRGNPPRPGYSPTERPTIAVVVPNFNDARHLPRCLRSVLEQDVLPDELLVIDDQSTDESITVIQSAISGCPWARLNVNPANLGTNRTINESLARVKSEYVLLLSANDFVLPGIFAHAKACLARMPRAGLWSAMAWLVDEADRTIRLHPSPVVALADAFLPAERCARLAHRVGNWFTGPTLTYHRETLCSVGGFDPAYGAPADFFTAVTIASLHGAAYTPEPFAGFRAHAGSYSSRALIDLGGLDAMLDHLREDGFRLSPSLFSKRFCDRTAERYRFAAVRASSGALIPDVAARQVGWKCSALRIVERTVPPGMHTLRVILAYLILRPYDIMPSLVNRALGWIIVRMRLLFMGRRSP